MSQQQLIDLHLRLQRKLSASTGIWCSGRVDSLTLALRKVEQELQARASTEFSSRFGARGHGPVGALGF